MHLYKKNPRYNEAVTFTGNKNIRNHNELSFFGLKLLEKLGKKNVIEAKC